MIIKNTLGKILKIIGILVMIAGAFQGYSQGKEAGHDLALALWIGTGYLVVGFLILGFGELLELMQKNVDNTKNILEKMSKTDDDEKALKDKNQS